MLNKAVIDLNALRQNALNVKRKLKKETKLCAVVKADAYGHGASACASALYGICDAFAVALVEEGIELRLGGVDKEILVLIAPFPKDLERAVFYDLTLTVCKREQLFAVMKEAEAQKKRVKIHLKFETGMNRQGVKDLEELKFLTETACKSKYAEITGIYSHFAKPEDEKERNAALDKFLLAIKLVKGYNNKITAHISASGGFLKGVHLDMVRIGILLYGYKPFPSTAISVKPVMNLYSPVIDVKHWEKGERAFYGAKPVKSGGDYAIVRYGYADGLSREDIGGFQHNARCMDVTAIQVGLLRGDYYNVLGDVEKTAEAYRTISYEILTKAAIRAEKIYLR